MSYSRAQQFENDDIIVLDASVSDVVNNEYYVLNTNEGDMKLPCGVVDMENNSLIRVGDNKYVRLIIDENLETNLEYEEGHTVADWPTKPTQLLINLYKEKKKLVEERKIKTLKRMWEIISQEIQKYNIKYRYTSQQCETKWKSLERAYKKKIENNKMTGRGRKTCPFEQELSDILKERRSIFPPVVMDSQITKSRMDLINEAGMQDTLTEDSMISNRASTATASTSKQSSPTPKKRKTNNIRKEVEKLKETIENRNTDRKQMEERKYEQRERMLKELQRRNDILEKLVEEK